MAIALLLKREKLTKNLTFDMVLGLSILHLLKNKEEVIAKVFTVKELEQSLTDAGFAIDYQWQPGKNKAVFIVAKKAE